MLLFWNNAVLSSCLNSCIITVIARSSNDEAIPKLSRKNCRIKRNLHSIGIATALLSLAMTSEITTISTTTTYPFNVLSV